MDAVRWYRPDPPTSHRPDTRVAPVTDPDDGPRTLTEQHATHDRQVRAPVSLRFGRVAGFDQGDEPRLRRGLEGSGSRPPTAYAGRSMPTTHSGSARASFGEHLAMLDDPGREVHARHRWALYRRVGDIDGGRVRMLRTLGVDEPHPADRCATVPLPDRTPADPTGPHRARGRRMSVLQPTTPA